MVWIEDGDVGVAAWANDAIRLEPGCSQAVIAWLLQGEHLALPT